MTDPLHIDAVATDRRITDDAAWVHCRVDADFAGFAGHFDRYPVVPGVCQLRWVTDLIAALTGAPPDVAEIRKMKFHNVIVPGTAFAVEVRRTPSGFSYRIASETETFASGIMVLR